MFIEIGGLVCLPGCARQVQRYAAERVAQLQADIARLTIEYEMLRALRHRSDFAVLGRAVREHINGRDGELGEMLKDAKRDLDTVWRPLMVAQSAFCQGCHGCGIRFVGYRGDSAMTCPNCDGTGAES